MVDFVYGDENNVYNTTELIGPLRPIEFEPFDNQSKQVRLYALNVGHLVIGAQSDQIQM